MHTAAYVGAGAQMLTSENVREEGREAALPDQRGAGGRNRAGGYFSLLGGKERAGERTAPIERYTVR